MLQAESKNSEFYFFWILGYICILSVKDCIWLDLKNENNVSVMILSKRNVWVKRL